MRIPPKPSRSNCKGYALLIVLLFLGVTLLVLGGLMSWTSSSSKLTSQNNQFLASESAAESADELVIATMTRDFLNQKLNSTNSYTPLIPTNTSAWPVAYNFSDASGIANKTTVNLGAQANVLQPLTSQFSRLQGYIQPVTITSTATPTAQHFNVPATVTENVEFDTIPIFQFAIFYNLNMEISPGASMTVQGPVFCNASIWAGNSSLTFNSAVDAVGFVSTATADPFADNYNGSPAPTFNVTPLTNQPSLTMPISGTNNSASSVQNILNLPAAAIAAPNSAYLLSSNQAYIYNEANLIISNSSVGINGASFYGTNITIYYENSNSATYLKLITNDVVSINTTTHTTNLYYSFVTNVTFYDFRESDTVQALQIDVGKFNTWLTNTVNYVYTNGVVKTKPAGGGSPWNSLNLNGSTSLGHQIDSIYVINKAPISATQLPAVRVVNGAQLPSADGLTIATPQPLYVEGNFNTQTNSTHVSVGTNDTTYTYPAAFMADAITILSSNWVDNGHAYTNGGSESSRTPSATTINAACLEGIVQTVPTISGNYSGGTENFLRLEEKWTGVNLYYNGSIIVMFSSQYATNYWQNTGNYYDAPSRQWSFDLNFANASKIPPLTPRVSVMLRTPGGWSVQ